MSALFERALAAIPGGVDSPVRSFSSVGGEPFFVERGEGAYLVDTDGKRYVDLVQSWGASILGHAHPKVVEAVARAAEDGTSYGAPTPREVELAEAIRGAVPSVEKVRLVSSGTEAGMTVLRLARGVTGRAKIVKFAGLLPRPRRRAARRRGQRRRDARAARFAGVTEGTVADTIVVPFNDDAALDEVFTRYGDRDRRGDRRTGRGEHGPRRAHRRLPRWTARALQRERHAARASTRSITGFRLGRGGAQGMFGVTPDLSMFGKVVGGGFPLAAFGGRADVMDDLAPLGPVYQAGTLSGNPVATAAGLAVLSLLDDAAYADLTDRATRLATGLGGVQRRRGGTGPGRAGRHAHGFVLRYRRAVHDYAAAQAADHDTYARFFHAMLERGVFLPAEWLRGAVREPRPRRRRARARSSTPPLPLPFWRCRHHRFGTSVTPKRSGGSGLGVLRSERGGGARGP